jgi:hypothetical protein
MDDVVLKPYRFNELYQCLAEQLGVKFIYKTAQQQEVAGDAVLAPDALKQLPAELKTALKDALESL